ncbi:MAG: hypothetical protein OJF52_004246 [Nitrospira sp.]|jgi:twinkle protein|nr:MAG: hypothetical protein OJF52_004246 [Nitrospira sp.]
MKTFDEFSIDLGGRTGVEAQTTCPQCSHTRKKSKVRCLSVNTVEGVWVCHHCGWAGTLRSGRCALPAVEACRQATLRKTVHSSAGCA